MFFLYSVVYAVGFVFLLPFFFLNALVKGKYSAGFFQKLGFIPKIDADGYPVVWIHCVSVGEVNAARPLVERLTGELPNYRFVFSTTTRTGQKLAAELFAHSFLSVFYFPFDLRSSVRRALRRTGPELVLLMETEIWFNFLREAHKRGVRIAIVNGRISERSFRRYGYIRHFMHHVLAYPDLALMQSNADSKRIMGLGMRANKVRVSGNLKFDQAPNDAESAPAAELRERFGISPEAPLIIAASTHSPEEKWVLEAFRIVWSRSHGSLPRLMIAPRHPERFEAVADEIKKSGFNWVRRTEKDSGRDKTAEVILLNSIGELRAAYTLAEVVFVGGSLIPHGGQSILEPGAAAKAIVTGPFTSNFTAAVNEFVDHHALVQLPKCSDKDIPERLANELTELIANNELRRNMGENAAAVVAKNRGATSKTVEMIRPLLAGEDVR